MDETANKPRNPNDLLIVTNVDNEDHEWQYDAVRTPLPYYIKAGETRKLPYYIAKHGVEKLIDKVLMKHGKLHTNPIFRAELMSKIVQGLEHINLVREKTANEVLLEEMKRKKDADPLEELLKRREIEAENQRAAEIAAMQPKAPLVETIGVAPVVSDPTTATTAPAPATPESDPLANALNTVEVPAILDPERQAVYDYAVNTMHMDLNHQPTKEKFDATPVDQLKTDLGYSEVTP